MEIDQLPTTPTRCSTLKDLLPAPWELLKELPAAGAFNDGIFLVRHAKTKDQAALKVNAFQTPPDADFLSQLHHKNITKYIGTISLGEFGFGILMEFCDEGDLKDYCGQQTEIPEDFIWHVFESVADALSYCYDGPEDAKYWRPILHNDIRPANVFLSSKSQSGEVLNAKYPRVVLGDFGLASHPSNYDSEYDGDEEYDEAAMLCSYSVQRDVCVLGRMIDSWDHKGEGYWPRCRGDKVSPYSKQLKELTGACQKANSMQRPLPNELLRMIRDARCARRQ
ncbi:kinase-like protein [Polyplosphaeria fusca]|uniref:EKC/KEOPS complex subunit BUD32 n=1 Tax=Polyplosphaeria fusca TaxID=682080 RepID=A0A9P4QS10_9PLEO|nr:kinase-like protein [Polyplosphaeria fusca]